MTERNGFGRQNNSGCGFNQYCTYIPTTILDSNIEIGRYLLSSVITISVTIYVV